MNTDDTDVRDSMSAFEWVDTDDLESPHANQIDCELDHIRIENDCLDELAIFDPDGDDDSRWLTALGPSFVDLGDMQ